MKISENGIKLLKLFEGLRLKAYLDIVKVPTIGYGSTGPDIKMGMTWTEEQCEERLKLDLSKFEKAVSTAVKVSINQNQFDALVCFSYNVGIGALQSSTLLKMLNKSDPISDVGNQFLRWDKAGGKQVAGLTRRREAEKKLFLTPLVESTKDTSSVDDIFTQDLNKDLFKML